MPKAGRFSSLSHMIRSVSERAMNRKVVECLVRAGAFEAVGFKHGRWVDIVFMQRALNSGRQGPPDAAGLTLSES